MLEKIFLHDIQNSASVLSAIKDLMDELNEKELREMISNISNSLFEDIYSYRLFLDAEKGTLRVRPDGIHLSELIQRIVGELGSIKAFRATPVKHTSNDIIMESDPSLLRRVITNLIKNALEASSNNEEINVKCEVSGENVLIEVQSIPLIPEEVKLRLFQKSVSTKGRGRGWGTYSVKLLTENYLNGQVNFVSTPEQGTCFRLKLPLSLERR